MRILITGALGYLGCELLCQLSNCPNIQVIGIDNDTTAFKARAGLFSRFENVNLYNVDIRDLSSLRSLPKVDLIIHLAAIVGYISCANTPIDCHSVNIVGTDNIAKLSTPILFFSSGSVYGDLGADCTEDSFTNPQTLYSLSKLQGEHLIKDVPNVVLRPATVYGVGAKVRDDLLVHTLVTEAIEKGTINLYQPTAMRSFYSLRKIANLCVDIVHNFENYEGEVVNVGCESSNITKLGLVQEIQKHIPTNLEIIPGADLDTRDYQVSYAKLASLWVDYNDNFSNNLPEVIKYYNTRNPYE